jgi:catechol 1,2-dioxygenase
MKLKRNSQINESGKFSTPARNETQLICDILGLESLVDETTFHQLAESQTIPSNPTESAILGPFWRANAPILPMEASIVHSLPDSCPEADHTYLSGRVLSAQTGKPIEGAELDIWHTAPNGLYEQQDNDQVDMNLRGRFATGAGGKYGIYCLRPTSYPIPDDGPAGRLLQLLDRHPMRPAHIHFIVSAPGYKSLTTQIFDRRDKYIADDAVFAVKESLICEFLPRKGDPKAQFELEYDFRLAEA